MNVADFISFHGEEQFEENAETNPVKVKIENFQIMFQKYNKYINIFKLESLIFSSSIENNIKKIFLVTNGLSDTKHLLTYGELFQTEGVKTLSETVNWEKIKKSSLWLNVISSHRPMTEVQNIFPQLLYAKNRRRFKFHS